MTRTAVAAPPAEPFGDLFAFIDAMTIAESESLVREIADRLEEARHQALIHALGWPFVDYTPKEEAMPPDPIPPIDDTSPDEPDDLPRDDDVGETGEDDAGTNPVDPTEENKP